MSIQLFGFANGLSQAFVRYTDTGEVTFFVRRLTTPVPAHVMPANEIAEAAPLALPVLGGVALNGTDVRALETATGQMVAAILMQRRRG